MRLLSHLLIIVGILSLAVLLPIYFHKNNTTAIPNTPKPTTSFLTFENATSPVRVVVGQTGIDISIKVAKNYSFSDNQAILIDSSQSIGEGNSVIYAHNWNSLFGKLGKVKTDDIVTVFLENGDEIKYQVSQKHVVSPETLSILKPTNDSRLTLFTCSGFLDKDRLVVVANQI